MKIIDQSYEICKTHGYTLQDVYKDIERAARVSYKSEDKITEDSAEKMVQRLISMEHYSPLEFGTIYLKIEQITCCHIITEANAKGCFAKPWVHRNEVIENENGRNVYYWYVTTNYRFIVENKLEKLLQYMCEPTEHHQKRTTVKFITNRAVSHELVRHRSMSFMQESQRYVAYDKDKFGSELTFIKPAWKQPEWDEQANETVLMHLLFANIEDTYMKLRTLGLTPQQARTVLPNATKTELYMCGFDKDWEHFFDLRDKTHVDPQMYDLAHPLHEEFNKIKHEKISE
nr:MAG TPA_asm: Thymidylate synthase complementing protein [Caudoviricetes sp.]